MSDGITHINIYSKGKTILGRKLSNFTRAPIETPDGYFASIEGYWYWLGTTNNKKDILRYMFGLQAKNVGRELGSKDWNNSALFKLKIYNAMLTKLVCHKDILDEFLKNKLPFRHYYVFNDQIVEPEEGQWLVDMWTFLQKQLNS